MRLTKLPHACVRIEQDGASLVVDPGVFSAAAEALRGADAVLVTHEHPDHLDAAAVRAAGVPVYAHPDVLAALDGVPGQPVRPGDTVEAAGFEVRVFGDRHAYVHEDVPDLPNNAYLVGGRVYYSGDSWSRPDVPVETLLLPIGGPWVKLGEAIDFVRALAPQRAFPTHDAVLTGPGQQFSDTWVQQRGGTDYRRLEIGSPVEL